MTKKMIGVFLFARFSWRDIPGVVGFLAAVGEGDAEVMSRPGEIKMMLVDAIAHEVES